MSQREELEELDTLAEAVLIRALSTGEQERLAELIKRSRACRRRFAEHQILSFELSEPDGVLSELIERDNSPKALRKLAAHPMFTMVSAAAIGAVIVALAFISIDNEANTVAAPSGSTAKTYRGTDSDSTSIAVLSKSHDERWGELTTADRTLLRDHLPLSPCTLQLESGTVQVDFYSGATVVLEGPALFEVIGANQARIAYGKARANVPPPARGFELTTERFEIIDLGTEFAVNIGPDGAGEVHVLEGEVKLLDSADANATESSLLTGEAVTYTQNGALTATASEPDQFQGADIFRLVENERTATWRRMIEAISADPATVVLYDFQSDGWSNSLPNRAKHGPADSDGTIVGCQWGNGRWTEKRGLAFSHPSHRVRIAIPGEYDALTLAMWLRVDEALSKSVSLLTSERTQARYLHWNLTEHSKGVAVMFADTVKLPHPERDIEDRQYYFGNRDVFLASRDSGQWLHLAVTVDPDSRQVTHYRNGVAIAAIPMEIDPRPLSLGIADLGNWPYEEWALGTEWEVRNLVGAMDEVIVSRRAWTTAEIADCYKVGKP